MKSEYKEDITLAEIKKILSAKSKDKELNFEQKQTHEHAKTFAILTPANSELLKTTLKDINLSDELATRITNVVPNEIELNLILEKEKDVDDSKKTEILEILKKYEK